LILRRCAAARALSWAYSASGRFLIVRVATRASVNPLWMQTGCAPPARQARDGALPPLHPVYRRDGDLDLWRPRTRHAGHERVPRIGPNGMISLPLEERRDRRPVNGR